ncbi:MAG: four helix bundle protein [Propionibacteriaceae bacterium]|jgi:hypothetical protein|nr:four helix bundle protein [Propionibacteriaceae bacterium]
MQVRAPADLAVVTHAQRLSHYVFKVTKKAPAYYRQTYAYRMQNLSLEIIEQLFRANQVFIGRGARPGAAERRRDRQDEAMAGAKLVVFLAQMAHEEGVILEKQFQHIAELAGTCEHLLAAWIKSDARRTAGEG